MRYTFFGETEKSSYPICILVNQIQKSEIKKEYLDPFSVSPEEIIAIQVYQAPNKKKTPMGEIKQYLEEELLSVLEGIQTRYILVTDSTYFKALTKATRVDANIGYVLDCAFGPWKVIYLPSHRMIFHDPEKVREKIAQAMNALKDHQGSSYTPPGADIIHTAQYPQTYEDIKKALNNLLLMNRPLTIDIETFSLKHPTAGIGTITFCWDQHNGIAFPVDYEPIKGATGAPYGRQIRNERVRKLLRNFFKKFVQKAIYHSISFDVYILIYQLFMDDILDTKGLLEGLEIMLKNWDDTKIITYLATNSCSGNDLSLKGQSQEYSGNYSMGDDIKDITKIPLEKLLEYNLIDGLSTWYVKDKWYQTMIDDEQEEIYETLFKPAIIDIIQMQLTGMPVNMKRVGEVKTELETEQNRVIQNIMNNPLVQKFTTDYLDVEYANKMNSKWKVKRIEAADSNQIFNPNSGPQLQALLFTWLKLPILNFTDSKQPSTDGETIEALTNHTENANVLNLLENLKILKVVSKLTSSFIPALEGAFEGPDGWHYLFGNFNLGGTLSGRLSSSDPNLQNLPSTGKGKPLNAKYAKLIKSCFEAPPGWLLLGIDFSSLEDRISALTTKDPNKLKVYTDGYDGHSLRAFAYFGDQMTGIDGNSVESINSIAKKYKPLRDRSKNPTFTLTYQGTFHALVKKYGFSTEQAQEVEAKYHELYEVSDAWVAEKLDKACETGFITAAFGLRLRTPLLKQVIRGTSKTPKEAEAEGRTAGNALGQSWCLLNSRAWIEFMRKVRASKHRELIRPCSQIHDAGYALVKDDLVLVDYCNEHLVKAVQWQEHPDIWHDEVKLGGEIAIFWPNWSNEMEIPNDARGDTVRALIEEKVSKWHEKNAGG